MIQPTTDEQTNHPASGVRELLDLLLAAGQLKKLPRTGWLLAGVQRPESVAEHSFRVALLALLLGELVEGVDSDRLLRMALLHDLPESLLTDLPLRAVQLVGRDAKRQAERAAWDRLLPAGTQLDSWRALWDEFEAGETLEAKLARAADKMEMLLQAYEYQRAGCRNLDDFWQNSDLPGDAPELVTALLNELERRRAALMEG